MWSELQDIRQWDVHHICAKILDAYDVYVVKKK